MSRQHLDDWFTSELNRKDAEKRAKEREFENSRSFQESYHSGQRSRGTISKLVNAIVWIVIGFTVMALLFGG